MARTTLRLIASLGVASAVLLAAAGPAWAAGETIGGCVLEQVHHAEEEYGSLGAVEADEKAFKTFEADLEGCVEAPSPILPELDEIIWGGLAFVILFAFMRWKGFPAVKRAMDARSEKIRADLDAADTAKADAIRRLAAEWRVDLDRCYGYSDSVTDLPMLEAVGHPVAVNPDRSLRETAAERGWPVAEFDSPVNLRTRLQTLPRPGAPLVSGTVLATAIAGAVTLWALKSRQRVMTGARMKG